MNLLGLLSGFQKERPLFPDPKQLALDMARRDREMAEKENELAELRKGLQTVIDELRDAIVEKNNEGGKS